MASMGIYVFKTKTLFKMLANNQGTDFGRHIIPSAIDSHRVVGYIFDGYWEDIGTVRRFYEVNLDMASPCLNLIFTIRPIPSTLAPFPGRLQSARRQFAKRLAGRWLSHSRSVYRNSVIGLRSLIARGVTIERSLIMGADYYESSEQVEEWSQAGQPCLGIGSDSVIQGAIIDKNARIGRQVIIRNQPDRPDEEHENWVAREGIVIVPKNAVLPDGMVI